MKEIEQTRFSVLLKYFRETYGLDYDGLAKAIGCSDLHLYYVECGRRKPDRNLVEALINYFRLEDNGKRALYDAAAEANESLPYDVEDFLKANPDQLKRVIMEMNKQRLENGGR